MNYIKLLLIVNTIYIIGITFLSLAGQSDPIQAAYALTLAILSGSMWRLGMYRFMPGLLALTIFHLAMVLAYLLLGISNLNGIGIATVHALFGIAFGLVLIQTRRLVAQEVHITNSKITS